MSTERKRCIRCERAIDAYAKLCPFCNWDQSESALPPRVEAAAQPDPDYVPPEEHNLRRRMLLIGAFVALIIVSFTLGSVIHMKSPDKKKSAAAATTDDNAALAVQPSPARKDIALVPTGASGVPDQPITSAPAAAPAQGVPPEYQRSDATAVSSVEYAQLAAREQAERKRMAAMTDPRSLTGAAYAQQPELRRRPMTPAPPAAGTDVPMTSASQEPLDRRISVRTRPRPEYQPLPNIHVDHPTTARLELLVGSDGRVKEVNVREGVPGQTAQLIAAVQSWRFRPATENGEPVDAPFVVDISFNQ